MVLELYQNDRFISSVVLKYYSILDTNPKKQGYSATIIPGLTHSYKLANICIINFTFSYLLIILILENGNWRSKCSIRLDY